MQRGLTWKDPLKYYNWTDGVQLPKVRFIVPPSLNDKKRAPLKLVKKTSRSGSLLLFHQVLLHLPGL